MVYAVYIAAAAVIGLLIGLVSLSVLWLKSTVMKNIRSRTLGLISVYDELLEEKSRELTTLARQDAAGNAGKAAADAPSVAAAASASQRSTPESALSASQMLEMTERSGGAVYRERELGSVYRKIRENFTFDAGEILTALGDDGPQKVGCHAARLLRELSPDTMYRLSTMPRETQETILRESLDEDGKALLEEYMQTHRSFGALGFYDYLRLRAACEPETAYLHIPRGMTPGCPEDGSTVVVPDDEICEGFCLEERNVLYDYSIRMRELS